MKENVAHPRVLTHKSSKISRGDSEPTHEKRMWMRNEMKKMQHQSTIEAITENMLIKKTCENIKWLKFSYITNEPKAACHPGRK